MHPLLITLTFLTLLAALVTGKVKQFVSKSTATQIFTNYQETLFEVEKQRALSLLHERKCSDCKDEELQATEVVKKPKEKKAGLRKVTVASLGINTSRPPDNSRINFWLLLHTQDQVLHGITARLIRKLYGNHPLFAHTPHLEHQLLDAMIVAKEKTRGITTPDEMLKLQFDHPKIAEAFYFIMRGGCDNEGRTYPSFLYYITFNPAPKGEHKKINLMFASHELLEVIFENHEVTKRVLSAREELWDIIENQETNRKVMDKGEAFNRTLLKRMLKETFENILNKSHQEHLKELFDLTLSKEGNFLIVYDPKTQITVREKVTVVYPALQKD